MPLRSMGRSRIMSKKKERESRVNGFGQRRRKLTLKSRKALGVEERLRESNRAQVEASLGKSEARQDKEKSQKRASRGGES